MKTALLLIAASLLLTACIQLESTASSQSNPLPAITEDAPTPEPRFQATEQAPGKNPSSTPAATASPEPTSYASATAIPSASVAAPIATTAIIPSASPTANPTPIAASTPEPTAPVTPTPTPSASPTATASPTTSAVSCNATACFSSTCTVDFSVDATFSAFARTAAETCQANNEKIHLKMDGSSQDIRILMRSDMQYAGQTSGNLIELSTSWFGQHPDDQGAIVHEMAHVHQGYAGVTVPSWLVEGIADYVRYWSGYANSWSYAHCTDASPHYTSGYWCSAAFLNYVEKTYDGQLIPKLNGQIREGQYNDAWFQSDTGKTEDQLWTECQQDDCKRTG